jgi:hypothetical protein
MGYEVSKKRKKMTMKKKNEVELLDSFRCLRGQIEKPEDILFCYYQSYNTVSSFLRSITPRLLVVTITADRV